MADIAELKALIDGARHCFAFTGAGVSTLSGIRDFRGKNGVYLEPWHGYAVEEILSLDCFERDPSLFYRWAEQFIYRLDEFHPSAVHLALAALEKQNKLEAVYTQNIDLLHQKAGSTRVYELHGSPAGHRCLACGKRFGYHPVAERVLAGEVPHCNCGGIIKPDIVFYGENLDEELLMQAERDMSRADLLLVLGSSLTVYPAAGLPRLCCQHGGKLVIVNAQETPYDHLAALRFDDLEQVFSAFL